MTEIGVLEAIHTSRALRRFKSDPVPETLIFQVLDAAIRAPSAGNAQNWAFVVVRDAEQRRKLGALYRKASDIAQIMYAARGRPAHVTEEQFQRFMTSGEYLWDHLADAPVILIPCQSRPRLPEQAVLPPEIDYSFADEERYLARIRGASIYPAVQNIILACRALGLGTTITLLFFLLLSGDLFLRRLVEILPTLSNKKQAVEISREIERNISTYLATITLMNLLVGVLTGFVAYACGLSDPVLWGTLVFILNYVPIIGPLCGLGTLLLAGLLTFEPLWQAMLPAGIYLLIHLMEGQFVTPMLLARRFTLNPVLVILSIIFWYWMWGVSGALLAVPLLATVKIVCDRIGPLMAIGHFVGGEAREQEPSPSA